MSTTPTTPTPTAPARKEGLYAFLPLNGNVCEVEYLKQGRREAYFVTPQTLAAVLGRLETKAGKLGDITSWIDLLGGTHPGLAILHDPKAMWVVLAYPQRQRTITHREHTDAQGRPRAPFKVTYPPTVWLQRWVNGRVDAARTRFYVANAVPTTLNHGALLRPFPFGHCYPEGHVCWGTVALGEAKKPWEVDDLFFGSNFNYDLAAVNWIDGGRTTWVTWAVRHPNDPLPVPFDGGRTLQQIIGERVTA